MGLPYTNNISRVNKNNMFKHIFISYTYIFQKAPMLFFKYFNRKQKLNSKTDVTEVPKKWK